MWVWDGLSLENKLNIPESKYLVNIFTKSQVAKRKSHVIDQQTNIDQINFSIGTPQFVFILDLFVF